MSCVARRRVFCVLGLGSSGGSRSKDVCQSPDVCLVTRRQCLPGRQQENKSKKGGSEAARVKREGVRRLAAGCGQKPGASKASVRRLTRPPASGAHLLRWGVAQHATGRRVLAVEALPAMGPPPPLPLAVWRRLRLAVPGFFAFAFAAAFAAAAACSAAFASARVCFSSRCVCFAPPVSSSCLCLLLGLARDVSVSCLLSSRCLPRDAACLRLLALGLPTRLALGLPTDATCVALRIDEIRRDKTRLVSTPRFPLSVPLEQHVYLACCSFSPTRSPVLTRECWEQGEGGVGAGGARALWRCPSGCRRLSRVPSSPTAPLGACGEHNWRRRRPMDGLPARNRRRCSPPPCPHPRSPGLPGP
jgi:hypothetical protein